MKVRGGRRERGDGQDRRCGQRRQGRGSPYHAVPDRRQWGARCAAALPPRL